MSQTAIHHCCRPSLSPHLSSSLISSSSLSRCCFSASSLPCVSAMLLEMRSSSACTCGVQQGAGAAAQWQPLLTSIATEVPATHSHV